MNSNSPDHAGREARLDELIATYLEAVEAGQSPDREEWLARHPDLADDLRAFFANHDRMAQVGEPLRASAAVEPPTSEAATLAPTKRLPTRCRARCVTSATTNCWRRSRGAAWASSTRRGRSA